MKSSYLLPLFALLLMASAASAQSIRGVIQQPNGKSVEFATVTLHKAADSLLVKGAITGDDGHYEIKDAPAGRYFIKANVIGMGDGKSEAFDYDGQNKTIETPLVLAEAATTIGQVTVVARRPPVEVKADKTILNVEGTVNSTGLSALELLRKAPGVTVDNNENVNVKGKNKVRILIDGRETPLSGKDLAATLKGLQAADIAAIEIISNPSAKYDASGNAGIINIRLKKNKAFGTNGNIGLEGIYGESAKGGVNLSLNHRGKKLSTFGSYNNHYGDWHNDQSFLREQNGQVFDQHATQVNQSRYNRLRVGADWFANDKHTFGVLVNGSYDPGNWDGESLAKISPSGGAVNSLLYATNKINQDRRDLNANFNYRFADTSGHSLNVDFDRGFYRIRGESYQPNIYKSPDGSEIQDEVIYANQTPTDIDITTGKVDYEQRLFKGTLGAGVKITDVRTDNTFNFFNILDGNPVKDLNVSNQFQYKERTNAAYVNYNRSFGKKLNMQTGLRLENTNYEGVSMSETNQNGEKVEKNYTKLFPSAALTYTFNPKMGLNLTYSRRIDRPSYQDLNPFQFKLDELTYQQGNKFLRPQFTNSIELSPTYQGYPVVTLGYSKTNDVFTQILFRSPVNPRAAYITQENIADQENYTLSLNIPTPIAKWWEGFVSVTGFRSHFESNFNNGTDSFMVDRAFSAMNLYAEQTLKLPKGWSVQLSGWYNTRAFWGTLRSNPQGVMDFGIQKQVLDGKGQLRLRVGDLLHTAGWSGENLFTPGLKMTARGTWEARTVTLNFNYRFGSSEVKAARQRKTGLEEESKRIKSGRN